MRFLSVLVLAVGLSMDATAVAAARGMTAHQVRLQHVALVALLFGGFQGLMPLLGYGLGAWIGPLVAAWDHWLIFVLLGGLGLKMIHESRRPHDGDDEATRATSDEELFRLRTMLALAVATSIDAFAAGITLPLMNVPVTVAVVTIGVTTALLSGLGLLVGRRFGAALGRRLDALGGVMLIVIGTKTLIEHLRAG